ncbi:hypothetical protein HD598_001402 [Neomicrococcus aestuarii]|uniref:Uncharacterized protein n=1 Tax=Neomicrococcus aestuarii TaxID=556325 RepID=A0A7W8TTN0_9MICC|nr:hypothetical protein [Neomicrococcus aestuarii]MBB5512715.1 hypothetical protein [Neomicrococcus aestuarii]
MSPTSTSTAASTSSRGLAIFTGLVLGQIGTTIALLPHLLSGGLMLLQNLWIRETLPEDMPFSMLPLSQYALLELVGILAVAATITGCLPYFVMPARRRSVTLGASLGVALGLLISIGQSFWEMAKGLGIGAGASSTAQLYFWGLLAGFVLFAALAALVTMVFASGTPTWSALMWALVAVPVTSWILSWTSPSGPFSGPFLMPLIESFTGPLPDPFSGDSTFLNYVYRFLPAIIVGLALAWYGWKPLGRLAIWVVDLALLFFIPVLATATQSAAGMRVLNGNVRDMLDYGSEVFRAQMRLDNPQLWVVGTALLIAVVVGIVRRSRTRSL